MRRDGLTQDGRGTTAIIWKLNPGIPAMLANFGIGFAKLEGDATLRLSLRAIGKRGGEGSYEGPKDSLDDRDALVGVGARCVRAKRRQR